ncbi:MAG TPA: hypothetical protein DCQ33_08505, partial [Nitrospira sp.]|nr:hypothetical protein [Nitrospira sp.]
MADEALEGFARNLHADVLSRAADGSIDAEHLTYGTFKEVVFTQLVLEQLEEQGITEEAQALHYEGQPRRRILRISGYSLRNLEGEDGVGKIDLFTTVYLDSPDLIAVDRASAKEALERARRFLEDMLGGDYEKLDPSSEAYALAKSICDRRTAIKQAKVLLLTDGLLKSKDVELDSLPGIEVSSEVWDIERLQRSQANSSHPAEIEIDVRQELDGKGLPCLKVPASSDDYESFLCVIPGDLLYKLYERFGQRLLELNVRSFLSITGKVNKGIRQTIRENPAHFFPFNNGLALTAAGVETSWTPEEGTIITGIRGLQIVNGGQTTASIHRAHKVDGAPLEAVHVQAKLTVIRTEGDDDRFFDLVRQISLFANSQNKVNMADLSANEPFHVELERIALRTWAPGEQSQWFYERARGSYQAIKAKQATTPAQKKSFDRRYPSNQRFSKTDLAKALNAWAPKPHVASLGGEKSFVHFMQGLGVKATEPKLSVEFFKNLVGLLILYRRTEKIVREAEIPSYRAQVVAYLVAYLSWRTNKKINLLDVWNQQKVPDQLAGTIKGWAMPIYDAIRQSAGAGNPGEWCKKVACWDHISRMDLVAGKSLGGMA